MCIPEFKGQIQTTSEKLINNAFAKVLLPGESNKVLYNTFSAGVKKFDQNILDSIESIEVCFLTNNTSLFDFNGLNHSFTLEIFELIDDI